MDCGFRNCTMPSHKMTLDEYQDISMKTAINIKNDFMFGVIYPALGMAGEAGECAEKVKKAIRDDNFVISEEKRKAIAIEIGDVLWYCQRLATGLGYKLSEIAKMNIEKLADRKARGTLHGSGDNR